MVKIRLHQFLSKSGIFNNKNEVIKAIKRQDVKVNEKVIVDQNYRVTDDAKITYKGNIIRRKRNVYYLFNKPKGVNCQKNQNKSIYTLIERFDVPEEIKRSLFTIGRLDVDTSGLLIITNDGELAGEILEPSSRIEKSYVVLLDKEITKKDLEFLRNGVIIMLDDRRYKTRPAKVEKTKINEVKITIKEGKKRQIRRMLGALKYKVINLKRVSIGDIKLGDLKSKQFKEVSREYIYDKIFK